MQIKYNTVLILVVAIQSLFTFPANAQVYINEILASNTSVNRDDDYLNYADWLELYNAGDQEIDLSGYSLSDEFENPGKWFIPTGTMIPANDFLLIWADGKDSGLHTNFKLKSSGEHVSLTDPEGEISDSVTFGEQLADVSYGREPGDGSEWFYFSLPTPNASNSTPFNFGPLFPPEYSLTGGFYSGSQTIRLSSKSTAAIIRYTLDGSDPSTDSEIYAEPIIIDYTAIIRSKCFADGFLPSKTVTSTYFIDEGSFSLPVISISAAPEDLWDDDVGIYVEGNGDCDCGMSLTGNYCCEDWEKQIGLEFFEPDGTKGFSMNAGLKIFGSGSRKRVPQRSLSIFARAEYGTAEIDYQLFPDKPIDEFKSFILRSSAHDWIKTMFRDAMIQSLSVGTMDLDYQAYRPSIVFINGVYWGIHNIREKMNEDYLASNHGVDPDNVDLLERDSWIVEGDNVAYRQLLDYVSSHDMTLDINYNYVKTKIDVDEYMDYLILHIYSAKSDWPANNIKFWRARTEEGIWRWMAYDMDFGFGLDTERFHKGTYDYNLLELVTTPNDDDVWVNPSWSTLLIRKMLENPGFRDEFIQRFSNHLNTTFHTQRVLDLIDDFKAQIEPEIPRHIERWGGTYALQLGYVFESLEEWDDNIEVMREFALRRPEHMRQHLADVFGLDASVELMMTISDLQGGMVEINNIPVADSSFSGTYFKDIPLTLVARERSGYEFSGWTVSGSGLESTTLLSKGASWKYLDNGSNQGTTWTAIDFIDSDWKTGEAQLGYGDGDENTVVSYGHDSNNKFITTYFRREFQVDDSLLYEKLIIDLMRDDGAVLYLNGHEILRSNIPEGNIDFQTFATLSVPAVSENIYLRREIPLDHLVVGRNVLAVEIHQHDVVSSDISFDLELSGIRVLSGETQFFSSSELTLNMEDNYKVTATFQRLVPLQDLFINEFLADNTTAFADEFGEYDDWIEIYNASDTDADLGGFYLTDDLFNPVLWQIPTGYSDQTTIPAGETILLWADNDVNQGPLHLGFRLNAEGEQIGLSLNGVDYIDSLSYSGQFKDISSGRYPDGDENWTSFNSSSPGRSNLTTQIDRAYSSDDRVSVYPNPTSGVVTFSIQTQDNVPVTILIVDVMGETIHFGSYLIQNEEALTFDLSSHPKGIYFAKFRFNNELISRKIIVQ